MNGYAGSFMTASAADHYQAQQRKEQEALLGNKWHQKMGFQKPTNLDQSINHIRQTEYAPFTREQEPPSIANMYLQQQYGGRERMQEDGYAIEEVEQEPSGRQMR